MFSVVSSVILPFAGQSVCILSVNVDFFKDIYKDLLWKIYWYVLINYYYTQVRYAQFKSSHNKLISRKHIYFLKGYISIWTVKE